MASTSRSLLQATYTPIRLPKTPPQSSPAGPSSPQEPDASSGGNSDKPGYRGIEKCALVRALAPTLGEVRLLLATASEPTVRNLLNALIKLIVAGYKECPRLLATFDSATLVQLAKSLLRLRRKMVGDIASATGGGRRLKPLQVRRLAALERQATQALQVAVPKKSAAKVELITAWMTQQESAVAGFEQSMKVEPVGYLHLERLTFTPQGTERGELVHSIPLAPGEEVNIAHREWSHTEEEFEKIVTDYLEEFSEQGVAEKSELSQTVNTQQQHSTAFNTGVTASGEYGPVHITATASYNVGDAASSSSAVSRNHSASLTSTSSSRAKKEHKVSFRVASASEVEDQSVQRISNPYKRHAARVDYYQMMRKWQVNLYRYGVRLVWDLTLPEPGSAFLSKMRELEQVRKELTVGFEARFTLAVSQIIRDDYLQRAAEYGVSVNEAPPPAQTVAIFLDSRGSLSQEKYVYEFEVPAGYQVSSAQLDYSENHESNRWGIQIQDVSGPRVTLFSAGSNWAAAKINTYNGWNGLSGKLYVHVNHWDIKFYFMTIRLTCDLKPSEFAAWQVRTWETIRDKAKQNYLETRQLLKERLDQLEDELQTEDALTLRKKEREEVMKGVLRWIGINDFRFFPFGTPANIEEELYDPTTGLVGDGAMLAKILAQGEVIKFLHHAVEWENMIYFLYPYFWTHASRWQSKMAITHPDPLHSAFLRSGSARVVLTIRPGFEDAFMAFLNTGDFLGIPPSPYLEIGKEIRNHAQTNYPGIPAANPVENSRPLLFTEQRRAWVDIQSLAALLQKYREAYTRYPTTSEGLGSLAGALEISPVIVPLLDPWGRPYRYVSPGAHGEYDLSSLGADGTEGGADLDEDINSWAEASLIGQWIEYTPTSALDVVFHGPLAGGEVGGGEETEAVAAGATAILLEALGSPSWVAKVAAIFAALALVALALYGLLVAIHAI